MKRLLAAACLFAAMISVAAAQPYPSRAVTLVVPFGAGGPTDALARIVGERMRASLGQPVIVENVAGAGGMTGANRVANAPPDGYQVLFGGSGNLVFNQILYKKPLFNSVTDFTPVALLTEQSLVLMARKNLPGEGLQDFMRHVKASKTASFGSSGAGSSTHLGCVMLNLAMGADATHVPYRGNGPAVTDLLGGQVQSLIASLPSSIEYVKAGKVRGLAVTSARRPETLPDLPAAGEFVPGYEVSSWYGIGVPRNTPADVVTTLNREVNAGLADAKTMARLAQEGGLSIGGTPADFAKLIADETEKWAKVITAANIKAD
jgi:tripartite-type tricarboxylate transporter receptor subunit TctC